MSILNSSIVPVGSTGYDIDNSLRFNDDDNAYLSFTPGTAGTSETTFTVSTWVKRGDVSASPQSIWDTAECTLQFHNDGRMFGNLKGTVSGNLFWYTDAYFRDTSAWYHIVAVYDTTQATDTNRFKLYVNGVLQTFSSISYPAQNQSMKNATVHYIGQEGTTYYMDGLLAEYNMVDGQALTPADFGETGDYGEWKPIEYAGTYGTNGFYLDFSGVDTTIIAATGGTIYTSGNYKYHKFTADGTFTVTSTQGISIVDALVIAGGGGGGGDNGGGGGAGGYLYTAEHSVSATAYSITVGNGGAGAGGSDAVNGQNSVFSSLTATGGGFGGTNNKTHAGASGGSGGGGGGGTAGGGGGGTAGQGYAGGSSGGNTPPKSGGGGGGEFSFGGPRGKTARPELEIVYLHPRMFYELL